MTRDAALRVTSLRKSYGARLALADVTLSVAPGEVCCLLGHNGAGKTTLISLAAGLIRPDAGTVHVLGHPAGSPAARAAVGLAGQELAVYPSLSVRDNLEYFGRIARLAAGTLRRRIDEVAEATSLGALLERRAGEMSGGEKRRLHVGMALMHRPRVVLLDEPTAGVDVTTRTGLLAMVRKLAADGTAVCYSTHYMPEVETLDGTVYVLNQGRLAASGSIGELSARHGRSGLILRFDGGRPVRDRALRRLAELPVPALASDDEDVVEVLTDEPDLWIGTAVRTLKETVEGLRAVEVMRPDFESAVVAVMNTAADAPCPAAAAREGRP